MSINNIYYIGQDPIKKYRTISPNAITGWRFDPDSGRRIEFILNPSTDDFIYDDYIVELYSEREARAFEGMNKYLIENALVIEHTEAEKPISKLNMLTDDEVEAIASTRMVKNLVEKLSTITSTVTLNRVLEAAQHIGRPKACLAAIEARIVEVRG